MNAILDGSLQCHQVAAKPHLFPPVPNISRSTPDPPPVACLKRQQARQVGILPVGLDKAASFTHLLDLVTVRQMHIKARLGHKIAQPAPAERGLKYDRCTLGPATNP